MPETVRSVPEVHHVKAVLIHGECRSGLALLVANGHVLRPAAPVIERVPDIVRAIAQMHHVKAVLKHRERRRSLALLIRNACLIAIADIDIHRLLAALPPDGAYTMCVILTKLDEIRVRIGVVVACQSGWVRRSPYSCSHLMLAGSGYSFVRKNWCSLRRKQFDRIGQPIDRPRLVSSGLATLLRSWSLASIRE